MPASITIALVASRPNVTGSRMLMPDSGPMPGSTPTSVPTRQPRKPYHSTPGCSATENPSHRLSRVSTVSESQYALLQRLLEDDGEEPVGENADADTVRRSGDQTAARPGDLPCDQHEQHERHGDDEAEGGVGGDRRRGDDEHSHRM